MRFMKVSLKCWSIKCFVFNYTDCSCSQFHISLCYDHKQRWVKSLIVILIKGLCKFESTFVLIDFFIIFSKDQWRKTQATKFGGDDQAITPSFAYLLNKAKDPSLPYFHYFFLMFHYCSCLVSVLVSLQNYSSCLPFVCYPKLRSLPLYGQSLPFQWNEGTNESFVVTLTVK